jgi:predicted nucleic acid-binding protein
MKFWDASALVPLLVEEPLTRPMQRIAAADAAILTWWATEVECASALARLERDGALSAKAAQAAFGRLRLLAESWHQVEPSDSLRATAVRFLRVHQLRAADALQLAAAFEACERHPASLDLVTLDERLAAAALREGFNVSGS